MIHLKKKLHQNEKKNLKEYFVASFSFLGEKNPSPPPPPQINLKLRCGKNI
jgi:hypothetical protein